MVKKEQLIKKGLLIGVGLAAYAQEKAESLAKELVRKGHLNRAEGKKLVRRIYQEADKSRKRITAVVESELKRLLGATDRTAQKPKRKGKRKR